MCQRAGPEPFSRSRSGPTPPRSPSGAPPDCPLHLAHDETEVRFQGIRAGRTEGAGRVNRDIQQTGAPAPVEFLLQSSASLGFQGAVAMGATRVAGPGEHAGDLRGVVRNRPVRASLRLARFSRRSAWRDCRQPASQAGNDPSQGVWRASLTLRLRRRVAGVIGQVVLETLDLIADCTNRTLTPRYPDYPLLELKAIRRRPFPERNQ